MDVRSAPPTVGDLDSVLAALKAAGESTRLRILAVLDDGELTVSELCRVLGQSQPRVSRHLRLLGQAGLLERHSEGTSAFYAHARTEPGRTMVSALLGLVDRDDPTIEADRQRRAAIRSERSSAASEYFEAIAERWDRIRSFHVDDAEVEAAVVTAASELSDGQPIQRLLDIGTGTGRMLELFADRIEHGLGVDLSSGMLKVARANLADGGLHHCSVRQANIYALDVPAGSIDLAIAHHVLHFLDDPAAAVAEAALTLRPGGQLIVVDFAPHQVDDLRAEHAHRWLGFEEHDIEAWCRHAGLTDVSVRHLVPTATPRPGRPEAEHGHLTVSLWSARRPSAELRPATPQSTTDVQPDDHPTDPDREKR